MPFYYWIGQWSADRKVLGGEMGGGGGIGKGPRGGNLTRVAVNTVCAICRCTNHYIHGYKHVTAFLFEA